MKYIYKLITLALFVASFSIINAQTTETFTISGSWTCPAGVTSVTVQCWGAGGGGGPRATNGRAGGGGGGAYASSIITVVPGNSYNYIVGTGGTSGTNGTNSSFNAISVVAAGGTGVLADVNAGGAGGTVAASTGTTRYAGGAGGTSGTDGGGGGGGAGSTGAGGNGGVGTGGTGTALSGGNGGAGASAVGPGSPGNNYGGGGGGARGAGNAGGTGANGYVTITYTVAAVPCAGTPAPGNTLSSANPICSGVAFTLSLSTPPTETGITYQWQSSPDGATWTNIVGATSATYVATQAVATYYHCRVTCANGGLIGNSSSLQETMASLSSCYCTPSGSSASYFIDDFSTTGGSTNITNNNSGYSATGYGSFTGQTVTQMQNSIVNFSISNDGGFYTYGYAIWVDWNQDGDFADAGERVFVTSAYATNTTGSFTVPLTATAGCTRMRITGNFLNSAPSDPCDTGIDGEFEDYTFCVTALVPCSGTPNAGTAGISVAIR
jgi:hypothetical protein